MEVRSTEKFSKYHEIESLAKTWYDIFNCAYVVCTEKIHGTNARYGWDENGFNIGTRNNKIKLEDGGHLGIPEVAIALDLPNKLKALSESIKGPVVLYGEVYGKGVQNLDYGLGVKTFAAFDLKYHGYYKDWDTVVKVCADLSIPIVPLLYSGPVDKEAFDRLIKEDSATAKKNGKQQKMEGIVIKPSTVLYNKYGERIIAKYKNIEFEERSSLGKRQPLPEHMNSVNEFVEEFVTAERLGHVIGQLRETGVEPTSLEQMGSILKLMHLDLMKEGKTEIEELEAKEITWKQISAMASVKTRRLYQEYLQDFSQRVK